MLKKIVLSLAAFGALAFADALTETMGAEIFEERLARASGRPAEERTFNRERLSNREGMLYREEIPNREGMLHREEKPYREAFVRNREAALNSAMLHESARFGRVRASAARTADHEASIVTVECAAAGCASSPVVQWTTEFLESYYGGMMKKDSPMEIMNYVNRKTNLRVYGSLPSAGIYKGGQGFLDAWYKMNQMMKLTKNAFVIESFDNVRLTAVVRSVRSGIFTATGKAVENMTFYVVLKFQTGHMMKMMRTGDVTGWKVKSMYVNYDTTTDVLLSEAAHSRSERNLHMFANVLTKYGATNPKTRAWIADDARMECQITPSYLLTQNVFQGADQFPVFLNALVDQGLVGLFNTNDDLVELGLKMDFPVWQKEIETNPAFKIVSADDNTIILLHRAHNHMTATGVTIRALDSWAKVSFNAQGLVQEIECGILNNIEPFEVNTALFKQMVHKIVQKKKELAATEPRWEL